MTTGAGHEADGPRRRPHGGPSSAFQGWLAYGLLLLLCAIQPALALTGGATEESKKHDLSCFAFLRDGDLFFACNSRAEQVTHFGDVEGFGLAADRGVLVLVRHRPTPQGRVLVQLGKEEPHYLTSYSAMQTIELATDKRSPFSPLQSYTRLEASCGTVLSITADPTMGYVPGLAHDALTGERVSFDPYKNFRCSSDRKTVAGWTRPNRIVLMEGLPPQRKLVETSYSYQLHYDVSPSGAYIAYTAIEQGRGKLCMVKGSASGDCIEEPLGWNLSVSDAGRVLIETASDQLCHYKDSFHYSLTPPGRIHRRRRVPCNLLLAPRRSGQ